MGAMKFTIESIFDPKGEIFIFFLSYPEQQQKEFIHCAVDKLHDRCILGYELCAFLGLIVFFLTAHSIRTYSQPVPSTHLYLVTFVPLSE